MGDFVDGAEKGSEIGARLLDWSRSFADRFPQGASPEEEARSVQERMNWADDAVAQMSRAGKVGAALGAAAEIGLRARGLIARSESREAAEGEFRSACAAWISLGYPGLARIGMEEMFFEDDERGESEALAAWAALGGETEPKKPRPPGKEIALDERARGGFLAFDRRGGDQTATVQRLLSILVGVPGVDETDRSDGVALVAGVHDRMGLIQQMALRMTQGDGEFAEEIGAEALAASGLDLAKAGRIGDRMEREIRAPSPKMLEIQAGQGAAAMKRGEWATGVFWAKRAAAGAPSPWLKGRWSQRMREGGWKEAASALFGGRDRGSGRSGWRKPRRPSGGDCGACSSPRSKARAGNGSRRRERISSGFSRLARRAESRWGRGRRRGPSRRAR